MEGPNLISQGVVLRTPILPFEMKCSLEEFHRIRKTPLFEEALLITSPELYGQVKKDLELNDRDLFLSVYKYFLRMSFRCTPFGIFSGLSLCRVSNLTQIIINPFEEHKRYSRLDSYYLNAFIEHILNDSALRRSIKWFSNNTISEVDESFRYVDYIIKGTTRRYVFSRIEQDEYLLGVISAANRGGTYEELMAAFGSDQGFSEAEKIDFLDQLVNARLLISELEPAITGVDIAERTILILNKYNVGSRYANYLESLTSLISEIDSEQIGNGLVKYERVLNLAMEWNSNLDKKHILQTDLSISTSTASINSDILAELQDVIVYLSKLNGIGKNNRLLGFAQSFTERYGDSWQSLSEVLDIEHGLGYPIGLSANRDNLPILDTVRWEINDNENFQFAQLSPDIVALLQKCLMEGHLEIEIPKGIAESYNAIGRLPTSFYSICSMLRNSNNECIELEYRGSGGPSASNLFGRFSTSQPDIKKLIDQLVEAEERSHPDIIFAEVVHLSQTRTGNVLTRKTPRKYEIPILSTPGVDSDHVIHLEDILVTVRHEKIYLYSKSKQKYIITRNTTAHNFGNDNVPYYQFLCELQGQENQTQLKWSWGGYDKLKFLPRVKYGRTVLSKARWIVEESDLHGGIINMGNLLRVLEELKESKQLPDIIVLSQYDNQIPLNLLDDFCREILIKELKKNGVLILEECLFNDQSLVVKGANGSFSNELIVPWINPIAKQFEFPPRPMVSQSESIRTFHPGSKWLFWKIYCGTLTADELLINRILPLMKSWEDNGICDLWFFIRYNDPQNHIRLRVRLNSNSLESSIIGLRSSLDSYLKNGRIWRFQIDTYQRELERYGEMTIDESETIFCIDSIMVIELLSLIDGDEGHQIRWKMVIAGIDTLLTDFGYSMSQKLDLMTEIRDSFKSEFNGGAKSTKKSLSELYRNNRTSIEAILSPDYLADWDSIRTVLRLRSQLMKPIVATIVFKLNSQKQVSIHNLVGSYIHMFVNRMLRSNQRAHEFVLYDLLVQYYLSQSGKSKSKTIRRTV